MRVTSAASVLRRWELEKRTFTGITFGNAQASAAAAVAVGRDVHVQLPESLLAAVGAAKIKVRAALRCTPPGQVAGRLPARRACPQPAPRLRWGCHTPSHPLTPPLLALCSPICAHGPWAPLRLAARLPPNPSQPRPVPRQLLEARDKSREYLKGEGVLVVPGEVAVDKVGRTRAGQAVAAWSGRCCAAARHALKERKKDLRPLPGVC